MELELDDYICRRLYLDGVFECAGTAAVKALVRPGDVVFDVGANAGYYTLLLAGRTGEQGRVHAFEPAPDTLTRLQRNLALNPALARVVQVHACALSDQTTTGKLHLAGPANSGVTHLEPPGQVNDPGRARIGVTGVIEVPCRTGDEVWAEMGRPGVKLIKLDIEGHELPALEGLRKLMVHSPELVVLVEVRASFLEAAGESPRTVFERLAGLGFASYELEIATGRFTRNDAPRCADVVIFSKRPL